MPWAGAHFDTACPLRRPRGVVLLALLFVLVLAEIAAMAALQVSSTTRQREQELELLFVGDQYRQAITHYYFAAPRGQGRLLPARLEDLLDDHRFPLPVQHLRRLYADPITGSTDWGLVKQGDRIIGIHSLSNAQPRKQAGFDASHSAFTGKSTYQDWVFSFQPSGAIRK